LISATIGSYARRANLERVKCGAPIPMPALGRLKGSVERVRELQLKAVSDFGFDPICRKTIQYGEQKLKIHFGKIATRQLTFYKNSGL
jgi:hypothetical protein